MIYDPYQEHNRAKERAKITWRRKLWTSVKEFCSTHKGYIYIALIILALFIASRGYV